MDQLYYESGYIVEGYYTYVADAESAQSVTSTCACDASVIAGGEVVMAYGSIESFATISATISHIHGADLFALNEAALAAEVERIRSTNVELSGVFSIATDASRTRNYSSDDSAAFTIDINNYRTRFSEATLEVASAIYAVAEQIKSTTVSTSVSSDLTVNAIRIQSSDVELNPSSILSVNAIRIQSSDVELNSASDITATVLRIQSGLSTLEAAIELVVDNVRTRDNDSNLTVTTATTALLGIVKEFTIDCESLFAPSVDCDVITNTFAVLDSTTTVNITVQVTRDVSAAIDSQSTQSATALRIQTSAIALDSQFTTTVDVAGILTEMAAELTATTEQTTVNSRTREFTIDLIGEFTQSATVVKTTETLVIFNEFVVQTTDAVKTSVADTQLTAFASELASTNKIGNPLVTIESRFSIVCNNSRIRDVAVLYPEEGQGLYTGLRTDLTGIEYTIEQEREILSNGFTISLWYKRESNTSTGAILHNEIYYWGYSSPSPAQTYMYNELRIINSNQLEFYGWYEGGIGGPNVAFNGVWSGVPADTDWHNIILYVERSGLAFGTLVNISASLDGIDLGSRTVSEHYPNVSGWFTSVFGIGSNTTGYQEPYFVPGDSGGWRSAMQYGESSQAIKSIKQLWVGRTSGYSQAVTNLYHDGLVDLGTTGTQGYSTTLNVPYIYNTFDYPFHDVVARDGSSLIEFTESYADPEPGIVARTFLDADGITVISTIGTLNSNFTQSTTATLITSKSAELSSTTTLSCTAVKTTNTSVDLDAFVTELTAASKTGTTLVTLESTATLTATAIAGTFVVVNLSSQTTLTAQVDRVQNNAADLTADTTLESIVSPLRSTTVDLDSAVTVATNARTIARSSPALAVNTQLTIDYDVLIANVANLESTATFTVTPTIVARAQANFTAFATELSLGKKTVGFEAHLEAFNTQLTVGRRFRLDPCLQLIIDSETRSQLILPEYRTTAITGETRTRRIISESRVITLDSETRVNKIKGCKL